MVNNDDVERLARHLLDEDLVRPASLPIARKKARQLLEKGWRWEQAETSWLDRVRTRSQP